MLCKISSLATTVIIAAWYEHEADFDQKEADFCAKGWVNTTKEREFDLGFLQILRKEDGLYIGPKVPEPFDEWLKSLSL